MAFLVDPADRGGLYRAIELNSLLWGGNYNPIIPVYKRLPKKWEHESLRRAPPEKIITGYLNGFDPDYVIPIGKCSDHPLEIGNRELLHESKLTEKQTPEIPNYGIGLEELTYDFIDNELKYKRNDDLHIAVAKFPQKYKTFLASVFGIMPEQIKERISKNFPDHSIFREIDATLQNFVDLFHPSRMFTRHLSNWALKKIFMKDLVLFFCDADSTLDIIDFWNLRASGNRVVPIPIQVCDQDNVRELAKELIESHNQPYAHNPNMLYYPIAQKSRSVSEESARSFFDSLDLPQKYDFRTWYPRYWNAWARENTQEKIHSPYSHEEEQSISSGDTRVELQARSPKIALPETYGSARFANELSLRFHSSKEPMAEVIPEGSDQLTATIASGSHWNWRLSPNGPVFLASERDPLFLTLPKAEPLMTRWFLERGWKVSLSGPGRIALQLVKQLGGVFGTSWLSHKGVLDLLSELEKESGLPWPHVTNKLRKIINENELYFSADQFLDRLVESNALRLGAKIQCPVCMRHNWFEIDSLKYQLPCRFCLSEFTPPLTAPKKIEWTYRAHGPFATSIAQGSFTVLLTLRFLKGSFSQGVTPLFSYTAEKNGKILEADLTCLYKSSTWKESREKVVHAECKSFNQFEQRDISRMRDLSAEFPGSVIIFSSLNTALKKREIRMISSLVKSERKKRLRGKIYSPIIVLTGVELFSSQNRLNPWKGRGGLYEDFGGRNFDISDLEQVADATQQLYLELPGWVDWSEAMRKKSRSE